MAPGLARPRYAAAALAIVCAGALWLGVQPAQAANQVGVVAWAGGTPPGAPLRGVILQPNGNGQRLVVTAANRASGKVTSAGTFDPSGAHLAAIRSAAKDVFSTAGITTADRPHAAYATATVQVGDNTKTALGINTASAQLSKLLIEINRALPAGSRLRDPGSGIVQAAAPPDTAACPPGESPTSIAKDVSLKDAANAGIVKLTAKGGFSGDVMAVDGTWKPIAGPVTVRMNIEVTSEPGAPAASALEQAVEAKLAGAKASNGTPVNFDVVVRQRAPGVSPTPCFHQVRLLNDKEYRGLAGDGSDPLTSVQTGEWPSGRGAAGDRQIWTHEALHLAGLEDQYQTVFKVGNKLYPVPDSVDIDDKKALADWAKSQGLNANAGAAGTRPKPGHKLDIMGDVFKGTEKLTQLDINNFAAIGSNTLNIKGNPGDILASKDTSQQNLGVGGPLNLTVKKGQPVHVDGLVTYCVDLHRHIPATGTVFDVLGPAGAQSEPVMQALQRVLEEAARRQPAPLDTTPGAQQAVWRVTDNSAPSGDEANAILAAAGIAPDTVFEQRHYNDPNTGSPDTAAVTPTGVLPPAPPLSEAEAGVLPLPTPKLAAVRVRKQRASRRRTVINATVLVKNAEDLVRLTLQRRRGRHWKTLKKFQPDAMTPASNLVALAVPRLTPGKYRVLAQGFGGKARGGFAVVRGR
jgi:hypothetical protein